MLADLNVSDLLDLVTILKIAIGALATVIVIGGKLFLTELAECKRDRLALRHRVESLERLAGQLDIRQRCTATDCPFRRMFESGSHRPPDRSPHASA